MRKTWIECKLHSETSCENVKGFHSLRTEGKTHTKVVAILVWVCAMTLCGMSGEISEELGNIVSYHHVDMNAKREEDYIVRTAEVAIMTIFSLFARIASPAPELPL